MVSPFEIPELLIYILQHLCYFDKRQARRVCKEWERVVNQYVLYNSRTSPLITPTKIEIQYGNPDDGPSISHTIRRVRESSGYKISHSFNLRMKNNGYIVYPIVSIYQLERIVDMCSVIDAVKFSATLHTNTGVRINEITTVYWADNGSMHVSTDDRGYDLYAYYPSYDWPTFIDLFLDASKNMYENTIIRMESRGYVSVIDQTIAACRTYIRIGPGVFQEWTRLIHPFRIGIDGTTCVRTLWPSLDYRRFDIGI